MNPDEALQFIESLLIAYGKRLNDTQRAVFRGSWLGQSYKEIHQTYPGCSREHIMQNVGPELWKLLEDVLGEGVSKKNLKGPIEKAKTQRSSVKLNPVNFASGEAAPSIANASVLYDLELDNEEDSSFFAPNRQAQQDWGTAPDTAFFCGRHRDLAQLEQWIQFDGCRLITLFGMGGNGKTMLSVRLAQQLKDQFDYLIWRSLDRPPALPDLIVELTQFLSNQDAACSDPVYLLHYLTHQRCLVILDGWEKLIRGDRHDGSYETSYSGYRDLLIHVGRTPHQSCVLITSREKPKEIMVLEGEQMRVRSWQLNGFAELDDEFFLTKGIFADSAQKWRSLTRCYNGNPQALNIAASYIRDVFSGDVAAFLEQFQQDAMYLGEVAALLEHQFDRLSSLEKMVVHSLAMQAEPMTFSEMLQSRTLSLSSIELQEVLQSLRRRALLEITTGRYSLQNLVQEYIRCRP